MNIAVALVLPLHMLAGIAWLALAVVVSMNAGKGGEKAFRPEMLAAVVAFLTGLYLWHVYYGARFDAPQRVLAFGVACAIAAAGVQGAMVGRMRRRLKKGTVSEDEARPAIARGHQIAAGLLVITLICMVMERQF
jgi:hypothetical protein